MYSKDFEIRWSDLDANRHVANSSFSDLITETRMIFFRESGFTQDSFAKHNIGPVIFSEEFYYVREIKPDEKIKVSIEILANSEDYKYLKFGHCIFNSEGKMSIYSEAFFGWFGLKERKLIPPPSEIAQILSTLEKDERWQLLDSSISLKNPKVPINKTI